MRKLFIALTLLAVAGTAGATMIDDFESYTAGQALIGQGPWVTGVLTPAFTVVSPDPVSGYTAAYGAVLAGQQSGVVSQGTSGGGVTRAFSGAEVAALGSHGVVSVLVKPEIMATCSVWLGTQSTQLGPQFWFLANGGSEIYSQSGYENTGQTYTVMHTYLIEMEMDFVSDLVTFYMQDLDAATPKVNLGTRSAWLNYGPERHQCHELRRGDHGG